MMCLFLFHRCSHWFTNTAKLNQLQGKSVLSQVYNCQQPLKKIFFWWRKWNQPLYFSVFFLLLYHHIKQNIFLSMICTIIEIKNVARGCAHRKRWKEENFFFIRDHMVCKYSNSCLRRVFVSEKDSSDSRNGSFCWWFLMQVYINEKQNFEIAVRFWKACLTMQNICCFPSKGFYIQYLL